MWEKQLNLKKITQPNQTKPHHHNKNTKMPLPWKGEQIQRIAEATSYVHVFFLDEILRTRQCSGSLGLCLNPFGTKAKLIRKMNNNKVTELLMYLSLKCSTKVPLQFSSSWT